jgi:hypothetical protein
LGGGLSGGRLEAVAVAGTGGVGAAGSRGASSLGAGRLAVKKKASSPERRGLEAWAGSFASGSNASVATCNRLSALLAM